MDRNRERYTHSLRFLSVPVLALGLMLLGSQLYAQQSAQPPSQQQYPSERPGQQQPGQTPEQSAQPTPDSQAQSGVQVFTGTIVKSGDKYMFQDAGSGATYNIDAQDQVKQFEGKKVRVHGTLDPSTKTIHVQ